MSKIFECDSDSDVEIRTDNQYAKNYNVWRKKEELNKLKTKYGDDVNLDEDSSSSSSDDEEGIKLTEENERDFFKALAYLKNKDPRIYNENVTFFQDKNKSNVVTERKKKKKDVPMYLKDYERKIILEKGGVLSDEEYDTENTSKPATYIEEQRHIKESLKTALNAIDDNVGDEEWGGLFKERNKTQEEKEKEDSDYTKWLLGEKEKVGEEVKIELQQLKEYWNNPNLDEGEKFLRDYILNKKFLDKDDDDYIPTYEEIIHDSDQDLSNDESTIEKQEEFEHKYNFRFEEPDQEFIKRYPRTMENSSRRKDDRRKIKRQETKDRKKKEKEEKMKELKTLQELKRKEIEEKLEKLKEITGNSDITFENQDIDGDFDPEAHDKRMQALFNDNYYQGPEEEQKPVFPEIDEELEIESWDKYEGANEDNTQSIPHCEDDDFNMDCDYDPNSSTQNELIEQTKRKKKRKRKSMVAEALSKPKPKFDPTDKTYEKYFDEYYKLNCEDIIGDIPCRFKYRTVVPNDFGLSTEEILLAKDRELNKWCSLKKAVQIRPDHVEKYDQIAYKKKAGNINLKKKILPSLFTPDTGEEGGKIPEVNSEEKMLSSESNNGGLRSPKVSRQSNSAVKCKDEDVNTNSAPKKETNNKNIKEQINHDIKDSKSLVNPNIDFREVKKCKSKRKIKKNISSETNQSQILQRKRKISINGQGAVEVPKKKNKKGKKQNKNNSKKLDISDARLSAYGINPKKFKNKLKFGNKILEK
ncbi:protein KRI1 homolog [Anoplophora glabripennis]|uniref:protein KRI1 homolog n=1 Tax=Anoplophora glabripennis TaxID=217634 RepID=UPI0008751729|nr:protein KRI1 homolog [Anoplophora glabripennis]